MYMMYMYMVPVRGPSTSLQAVSGLVGHNSRERHLVHCPSHFLSSSASSSPLESMMHGSQSGHARWKMADGNDTIVHGRSPCWALSLTALVVSFV